MGQSANPSARTLLIGSRDALRAPKQEGQRTEAGEVEVATEGATGTGIVVETGTETGTGITARVDTVEATVVAVTVVEATVVGTE